MINDLLASGEIPDLFAGDEYESIISGVRNEVKSAGIQDTRENCWSFFIDRVRKQLKVVLCFSPVGTTLRVRSRKFPAIVNCTNIDWFHEWPQEALMSVSSRFLSEVDLIPVSVLGEDCRIGISIWEVERKNCEKDKGRERREREREIEPYFIFDCRMSIVLPSASLWPMFTRVSMR